MDVGPLRRALVVDVIERLNGALVLLVQASKLKGSSSEDEISLAGRLTLDIWRVSELSAWAQKWVLRFHYLIEE